MGAGVAGDQAALRVRDPDVAEAEPPDGVFVHERRPWPGLFAREPGFHGRPLGDGRDAQLHARITGRSARLQH